MKFSLFKKNKNQKIIGLTFLGLLVIIIIVLMFFRTENVNNQLTDPGSTILNPVFLNNQEKTVLNIKPEIKVQVLQRDAAGKIILYKVINNDSDIVTDLNQVEAQRPDLKK